MMLLQPQSLQDHHQALKAECHQEWVEWEACHQEWVECQIWAEWC